MSDEKYAIEVESLTKIYPVHKKLGGNVPVVKPAVDAINFKVKKGEIFGLLGPNGAGKTTTIKMLSTLLLPTSGKATILGYDVDSQSTEVRKRINLVSGGERGLYYRLTGKGNLRFFADLYRVPKNIRDERIADLLETVGLTSAADKRVEDYSRGMKQRLHLARGLINDPEVLFLDEPTIGLDPEIACEIRIMIEDMAKMGKTILLTTHYMKEAEQLCDSINVISKGKIIASGTLSDLQNLVKDDSIIEIEVRDLDQSSIESIRSIDGVAGVQVNSAIPCPIIRVQVRTGSNLMIKIASKFENCGLVRVSSEEPTLEDAYLRLVKNND
jgi:ABC-2 type transport system ATP-binding protein